MTKGQQNIELYQARMTFAFEKMVRQRSFRKGDLVLTVRKPFMSKSTGKFENKWEGPYVVNTVRTNDAYHLMDVNGNRHELPINGKFQTKYYQ